MNITYWDEFKSSDLSKSKNLWLVRKIDFDDFRVTDNFRKLDEEQIKRAVDVLNSIMYSNIVTLLPDLLAYKLIDAKGKEIACGIKDMSTSEKIFFICYLAEEFRIPLLIQNDLGVLTNSSLRSLYSLFKDSKYITICTNDITDAYVLSVRLTGKPDERFKPVIK